MTKFIKNVHDRPYLIFPLLGVLVAATTWMLLSSMAQRGRGTTKYNIRITKSASEIAGDEMMGRGWWEEEQFAKFARQKGWTDVQLTVKTTIGDQLQKYVASAAAGEAPDIIQLQPQDVARWHDLGLIEPLDEYLASWDAYREGHINEEVLKLCRGTDGRLLCLCDSRHSPGLYGVRRDWLERVGRKAPQTWEEARELWRIFTHEDPDGNGRDDTYGYAMDMRTHRTRSSIAGHAYALEPFLLAAGVRWLKTDSKGTVQPAFNVPAAAETLEFIKQCYEEGLFGEDVMYRTEDVESLIRFLSENSAGMSAHIFPNYYKPLALQYGVYDKVELVPFLWKDQQAKEEEQYGTMTILSGPRCILKTSRNKAAAWKFLEYWLSRDGLTQAFSKRGNARERYFGRFGIFSSDVPWLPLRTDVEIEVNIDPWMIELVQPLERYVVVQPCTATWGQISQVISEIFVDYYLGRYDSAQQALDEAERQSLQILRNYEKNLHLGAIEHDQTPKQELMGKK